LLGFTLAGFVAGEGCFRLSTTPRLHPDGDPILKFIFTVHDEATFAVQSTKELADVVVPFMDTFLPPSKKREQYLAWRRQLLAFWEHDARRRRPCTVEGCDRLQRAKGYCRHHYFKRFGR
jgi:hypothetical protein